MFVCEYFHQFGCWPVESIKFSSSPILTVRNRILVDEMSIMEQAYQTQLTLPETGHGVHDLLQSEKKYYEKSSCHLVLSSVVILLLFGVFFFPLYLSNCFAGEHLEGSIR